MWLRNLVALVVLMYASCGRPPDTTSHGGGVADHVSFVDHLRARGVTVEIVGRIEQPFLRVPGVALRLSGGKLEGSVEIQSYEYKTATEAQRDLKKIGPRVQTQNTYISWVGTPHLYGKGRVLVLYVGDDPAVRDMLLDALGGPLREGDG